MDEKIAFRPAVPPKQRQLTRTEKRVYACLNHTAFLLAALVVFLVLCAFGRWENAREYQKTLSTFDKATEAHCKALLIPPEGYYVSRLSRLSAALSSPHSLSQSKGAATWVLEPGPYAEYILGAFGKEDWWLSERPFLIAITPDLDKGNTIITLLTPEFERLRAQGVTLPEEIERRVNWVAWREDESPYEVLVRSLQGKTDVILVEDMVRSFVAAGLRDAMRDATREIDDAQSQEASELNSESSPMAGLQEAVWSLRERKDEREIGLLRCANQMTLHAIRETRDKMYIGISESKTSAILKKEMARTGLLGGEGLVLFGENAALPHGTGSNRILGKEDLVLIDVGGKWGGYVSDITRTFALPKSDIPQPHREAWETVRKAQYAPHQYLKDYNTSDPPKYSDLDQAARDIVSSYMSPGISTQSTADFSVFTHRLGHGIGLEGHERPYLVPGPAGNKHVKTGTVFSLEPGIYIPHQQGEGNDESSLNGLGVRLEDCFVVTEDKHGRLNGEWLSGPVGRWGDI